MVDDREDTLADSFWAVTRRLRELSRQTLAPWAVAPSQFRALGMLLRHGTMRLSELSDHLHIAARSATEVVDALEEHGFVARQPDPVDRRAVLVQLTPEGERVGTAIRRARTAETEKFFSPLSADDRAELIRILRALAATDT